MTLGSNLGFPVQGLQSSNTCENTITAFKLFNDSCNMEATFTNQPIKQLGLDARMNFPSKLHGLLAEVEKGNYGSIDVISWNSDGDAFVINRPDEFARTMLPNFFRTGKFKSFQRQLCAYGFSRCNHYARREDVHMYRHEHFHRDLPEKLVFVRRRPKARDDRKEKTKKEDNSKVVESSKVEANGDPLFQLVLDGLCQDLPTNNFSLSDWDVEKETLRDDSGKDLRDMSLP